jgi:hypothetical protein
MTCRWRVTFAHDGLSSHSDARRYHASWAPSFAHSGTESTGAQGVDELNVMSAAVVAADVAPHSRTLSAGSDHQQDCNCRSQAARALDPVFARQLLTYRKIMNLRLGLLMNFGMPTMKAGIRRIAN